MRRWVGLLGRTSVRGAFGYAKLINHTKVTDESGFWALVGDSEVARGETESESDNRLQPQQSGGGPMPEEVCEAVEACCAGKDSEEYVFTWPNGKQILDFRTSWANACKEAEVARLQFLDLRRSATRNIMRKGFQRRSA